MPQVIESISVSLVDVTDVEQQVMLNFSLPLHSLVDAIAKLGLKELIQLKRLIESQINQALENYTGDDDLILDEIERQHPIYDATMRQAVQSTMDESQQTQKFTNGSDFRDWLVSIVSSGYGNSSK
jgi:hypothetical protein